MPKHPRLHRRGGRYYHRASVPLDIRATYPNSEETFSLGTSDYQEAVRKVREAAAKVDRQFDAHRRWKAQREQPAVQELSDGQIKRIGEVYYAFRLEEEFFRSEAEEVLSWEGIEIRLAEDSPSWRKLARELQAASIRAGKAIRARNKGDVVETPEASAPAPTSTSPMLSMAVEEWAAEKSGSTWVPKTEREELADLAAGVLLPGLLVDRLMVLDVFLE